MQRSKRVYGTPVYATEALPVGDDFTFKEGSYMSLAHGHLYFFWTAQVYGCLCARCMSLPPLDGEYREGQHGPLPIPHWVGSTLEEQALYGPFHAERYVEIADALDLTRFTSPWQFLPSELAALEQARREHEQKK